MPPSEEVPEPDGPTPGEQGPDHTEVPSYEQGDRAPVEETPDDQLFSYETEDAGTRLRVELALEQLPEDTQICDVPVSYKEEGESIGIVEIDGVRSVSVNARRFRSMRDAERAAAVQAGYLATMRYHFQIDAKGTVEALREYTSAAHAAARLKGVGRVASWEPTASDVVSETRAVPKTLPKLFDEACEQRLLTGRIDESIPSVVREAVERIPSRGTKSALEFIAEEDRSLGSSAKIYQDQVAPLRQELEKLQGDQRTTERDDYVPPQGSGEKVPLTPEGVQWKVEPFLGGYFRQQLFRYDPDEQRIVAEPTDAFEFQLTDVPDDLAERKHYTFTGLYIPGEENRLPLHERALPFPDTVSPAEDFMLMRSTTGIFSMHLRAGREEPTEPVEYSFTFVLAQTADNVIADLPTARDHATITGPHDDETAALLTRLQDNAFLGTADRARGVVGDTRSRFKYPEEEERDPMNQAYKLAGSDLHPVMTEQGIADCHWSNIRASDLGRNLGVAMRTPSGFSVRKIQEYPDTALIGGIGHAWSERWDEGEKQWIRLDATPPGENEEEGEEGEPSGPGEGEDDSEYRNRGRVEESGVMELTDEEIEQLMEEVGGTGGDSTEARGGRLFRERTGVDPEDWKKVNDFIQAVNRLQIPAASRIDEAHPHLTHFKERITAPIGTLAREWQKLFCFIAKMRQREIDTYRGPVRESEGELLTDDVAAYTDVMSGNDDPTGFFMPDIKREMRVDTHSFQEDVIVDLTASMDETDAHGNVMRIEQKKVVLTMLYQLMMLNRQLNDTRVSTKLRTPLDVRSSVYSIHGQSEAEEDEEEARDGWFAELKASTEMVTEQVLVHLAREFDKTTPGSGDLVGALRMYRESIDDRLAQKIRSGEIVKMLTIHSDGNTWCGICGHEGCGVQMHRESIHQAQKEVRLLREMGVIVQGIGYTEQGRSIRLVCEDPSDTSAAAVVENTKHAVQVRHSMITKNLQNI